MGDKKLVTRGCWWERHPEPRIWKNGFLKFYVYEKAMLGTNQGRGKYFEMLIELKKIIKAQSNVFLYEVRFVKYLFSKLHARVKTKIDSAPVQFTCSLIYSTNMY